MENLARLGRLAAIVVAATILVCADTGPANSGTKARIFERLRNGDDRAAAGLLEAHLRRYPDDGIMLYNAACVQCRLGDVDRGARYLRAAVKAGFRDISHLRRDPDLRPLRGHPVYKAIVAARHAADESLTREQLLRWRNDLQRPGYRFEGDPQRRLIFVSALDEKSHRRMRRMISGQADHLTQTLFGISPPREYAFVVVPHEQDAARLVAEHHVGGVYYHPRRELIATDAGESIRHEFVHVLHHRHMDELGQQHPLWVQEGLATLYESYQVKGRGSVEFTTNHRHRVTLQMARRGRLLPWSQIFAMQSGDLRAEAMRGYAQLRSIFHFVAEKHGVETWYRTYVDLFDEDPTGVTALEMVFGEPVEHIEERWHRWLSRQPAPAATPSRPEA